MCVRHVLVGIAMIIAVALHPLDGASQTWNPDQLAVWSIVQAQWDASMQKDTTWATRFLHDSFVGWARQNPAPRNKQSTDRWARYSMGNTTTLLQELHPISIVVQGNTAVAHYVYSLATENQKQERETVHGRYTDTLIRDGATWRFLAWHGGDDPGGND